VHGVQFHPESIGTGHGKAVLENFLRLAGAHV
jgi:anthranilate/para-aminobenzoate synthase component II